MSYIQPPSAVGKSYGDTPAEREIMLSKLRVAATRAKLEVTLLEDLQIELRQRAKDCAGIRARLKAEGIEL
jgi:hypothetical protein